MNFLSLTGIPAAPTNVTARVTGPLAIFVSWIPSKAIVQRYQHQILQKNPIVIFKTLKFFAVTRFNALTLTLDIYTSWYVSDLRIDTVEELIIVNSGFGFRRHQRPCRPAHRDNVNVLTILSPGAKPVDC